jgi:hypothetical protein
MSLVTTAALITALLVTRPSSDQSMTPAQREAITLIESRGGSVQFGSPTNVGLLIDLNWAEQVPNGPCAVKPKCRTPSRPSGPE